MTHFSIEPRTRKHVKGYKFLLFARNLSNNHGKQYMDTTTETGLDARKTASKNFFHKAVEARGEFIGNRIIDKTVQPKPSSVKCSHLGQILNFKKIDLGQL